MQFHAGASVPKFHDYATNHTTHINHVCYHTYEISTLSCIRGEPGRDERSVSTSQIPDRLSTPPPPPICPGAVLN
jgi:hypothetical protein